MSSSLASAMKRAKAVCGGRAASSVGALSSRRTAVEPAANGQDGGGDAGVGIVGGGDRGGDGGTDGGVGGAGGGALKR